MHTILQVTQHSIVPYSVAIHVVLMTSATKLDAHVYLLKLYLQEFFELILILTPMDYGSKGKIGCFEGKKVAKSPKLERPHPPKLVCMHFTTTSTCMNFFSQFYFLTPWTIVHGSKGKFGCFEGKQKKGQNL